MIENQRQLRFPAGISDAGYDVVENQSGKRVGTTRISKKGNSRIRRILHLPAFNVVRYEKDRFKPFFDRLISKGKKKMQAYVAVQKKLLVLMYTLWRKDQVNPEVTSSNKEAKSLFSVVFEENQIISQQLKEVAPTSRATQDELLCNMSPKVLFPVKQSY